MLITRNEMDDTKLAWLLVIPSILIIVSINLYPLLYSVFLSVSKVQPLTLETSFVGITNYLSVLRKPDFFEAFLNTVYFTVASLIIQVVFGILIAIALSGPTRTAHILRALVILPWAVPTIVDALLWQWIYHPQYGALSGLLNSLGLIDQPVQWLGNTLLAMPAVIIADTWKMLPLYVVMFLSALQLVPDELYQAADIDGAGPWNKFVHVTLPYLVPTLFVVLVLRTIEAFRVFEIIFLMTGGGPSGSTTVVGYYAFLEAFRNLNYGAGAAASNMIVLFILIISMTYLVVLRENRSR